MGLLSALKSRFFAPKLCRVANTGDVAATAECIARTSVVVVGADLGDSVPFDADKESVLRIVEAAAQKTSFDGAIHKYEINGETFLPVFTDSATAEGFCGAYCSLLGHIHAFRLFRLPGALIRHLIAHQDIIVIDPQSDNEVEVERSKSQAIRGRLPETDSFNDAQFVSVVLPMAGIPGRIEFRPET